MKLPFAVLFCSIFSFAAVLPAGVRTEEPSSAPTTTSAPASDLSRAVAEYLSYELKPGVSPPPFWPIAKRFGKEEAFREAFRQADQLNSDRCRAGLLYIAEQQQYPFVHEAAVKALKSSEWELHDSGVRWCKWNTKTLTPEERRAFDKSVRAIFEEAPHAYLEYMQQHATKDDLPLIRRVYAAEPRKQGPNDWVDLKNTEFALTFSDVPERATRLNLLLLRLRLGDEEEPLREIRATLAKDKDAQESAWGICLAARSGKKAFGPQIAAALEDTRAVPEPIAAPLMAKDNPFYKVLYVTRICDLAVRAVHDLAEPDAKWPFATPSAGTWWLGDKGIEPLTYRHELSRATSQRLGALVSTQIAGFTEEQRAHARERARAAGWLAPK